MTHCFQKVKVPKFMSSSYRKAELFQTWRAIFESYSFRVKIAVRLLSLFASQFLQSLVNYLQATFQAALFQLAALRKPIPIQFCINRAGSDFCFAGTLALKESFED